MLRRPSATLPLLSLAAVLTGGVGLHLARAFPTSAPRAPGVGYDLCVAPGQTLLIDTSFTQLVVGRDCAQDQTTTVINGNLIVDDVWIQEGAVVRVQGVHPLSIFATGGVRIDGTLDLSGFSSPGVTTLNTTNIPELGAPGAAGGGSGGSSSSLTAASTSKGSDGFGAFGLPGQGGGGGETGWTNVNQHPDSRRGAGGGGGAFGHDQAQTGPASLGDWDQSFIGLDVERGFPNRNPNAQGALTGAAGPKGGRQGQTPFQDADSANDFYGVAVQADGSKLVGELQLPWAGSGGGGGGDASFVSGGGVWPPLPFNAAGDEKGGPGGGGGGSLWIYSTDDIVFGPRGLILARGGSGGGGENTSFLNRVGGAGGGGSGGHVILQTLGVIDLRQSLGAAGLPGMLTGGILASGGQGGAGRADLGGATLTANGKRETAPQFDACPKTLSGGNYPTLGENACRGHIDGAGGDGGPGVVQLHTRTGLDPNGPSILLPAGLDLEDLVVPKPVCSEADCNLIPQSAP